MRWGLLLLAAACYRAPSTDDACAIECTSSCPGSLTCQSGFCVTPGSAGCHPSFTTVAAGTEFACAIDDKQELWCWGNNAHTQVLPNADVLQMPRKRLVDRTRHWTAIDAGVGHVCGIADDQLYCWGQNTHGEVSATVIGDVDEPLQITFAQAPATWTAVSAGDESTCAIGDGTLYCWGANDAGQLGDGTTADHGVPAPIMDSHHDWTAVSISHVHACAISAADGVFCWGDNASGEIGPNGGAISFVPVLATAEPATSVATSALATCITTADQMGQLVCWGHDANHELGDQALTGTLGDHTLEPIPASSLTGWSEVSAGDVTMCGRLQTGDLYCWGDGANGGLGTGLWTTNGFHKVDTGVAQVSVGFAIDVDPDTKHDAADRELACSIAGTDVRCWGLNRFGQLGQGVATMALAPTEVSGGGHTFASLVADGNHACGIEAGVLFCWGSDQSGQTTGRPVGDVSPCLASVCDLGVPTEIGFAAGATGVAVGADFTCSLAASAIECWGNNIRGSLGGGDQATSEPRSVISPTGSWSSLLQVGAAGACAIADGATYCWGIVLVDVNTPTAEPLLDGVLGFAADGQNVCITDVTGMLGCTGDNSVGNYGNGEGTGCDLDGLCDNGESCASCPSDCGATCSSDLASLGRMYNAIATTSTAITTCGLRGDGVVECWGTNKHAQCGTAATDFVSLPNMLPMSGCTAIAVGQQHACAICGGAISCWGDNSLAQLGTGAPSTDPVAVPRAIALTLPGEPWTKLVATTNATCAITSLGHTYCWGTDDHGALGNGATSANLPTVLQ